MKKKNKEKSDIWARFPKLNNISKDKFPNHLLIIPDGNGRWAKKLGKYPLEGHKKGAEVIKKVLNDLSDLPIKYVTVWGFSSDNWRRAPWEVSGLMKIFEQYVKNNLSQLLKNDKRFIQLGRKDRIPVSLKNILSAVEKDTQKGKNGFFCIAIDFGGDDQELRMMEKARKLPKNINLNSDTIKKLRDGDGKIPPADLIIRTSGEQRISNLGWLAENAEFYSIKRLLPDTNTKDFVEGIIEYSKRDRRFGGRKN